MKNIFVGVMAFAVCVLLVQCRKPSFTDFDNHGNVDFPDALTVTTGDNSKGEFNTVEKKLKYLWKNNDVLFVYSGKKAGDGNFVGSKFLGKLDLIEGKDTYTGTFYGGTKKPVEGDTHLRFIHFGTSVSTASDGTASVSFASQTGTLGEISQKVVAVGEMEIKENGIYDGCKLEPQFSVVMLKFMSFPGSDITVSGIAANKIEVSNTGDVSFTVNGGSKDGAAMVLQNAVGTATEYYAVFLPETAPTEHVFSSSVSGTDLSGTKWYKMNFKFTANGYYVGSNSGGTCAPFECKGTWKDGVLPGKFSVAEGKQVQFAHGNLQFHTTNKIWRFAPNQWDMLCTSSCSVSSDYKENSNKWIDLLGWGTSGYAHGAVCYQPWSTTFEKTYYYAYGGYYNLYDGTGKADWGYNAISNGGNTENSGWHALKREDLYYLLDRKDNEGKSLYGEGVVHGVNGFIILPDNWTSPDGVTFTQEAFYWANSFSDADWAKMEAAGAVFLPAAGNRSTTNTASVTGAGYYWLSSYSGYYNEAHLLYFWNEGVSYYKGIDYYGYQTSRAHCYGFTVRLAK
ncbi:MAG: hypothetical protein Q4F69_07590 [Bacteroidia bacterium]|nr:hypothetical protein [Bacteroidia bacterium]